MKHFLPCLSANLTVCPSLRLKAFLGTLVKLGVADGHGDLISHDLQYLYPAGETWVFMDTESFEQYELTESQLHGCQPFLKEGESYRSLFADQQPLTLEMADIIALQVTSTAPPTHSVGSQSSVMKEAMLENGLEVRVPLFIKDGDVIRVNRRDRSYTGKESR